MPYIKVKPAALSDAADDLDRIKNKISSIEEKYMAAYRKIDWEVINKAHISSKAQKVSRNLQNQEMALFAMVNFLENSYQRYMSISGLKPEDNDTINGNISTNTKETKRKEKEDFIHGIKKGWDEFTDQVEETTENIKEGISDFADDVKEGFEDAIDYVIDGTIHVSQEVWEWLNELVNKYKVPLKTAYQLYQVFQSYKIPVGIISALDKHFEVFGFANVLLYITDNYPSEEVHFSRNENMKNHTIPKTEEEARELEWRSGVAANCHQFSAPDKDNVKWVSPDGTCEVIFDKDGDVVTDTRDYGTYNFSDPDNDPLGHFVKDILPWIVRGNTPDENESITWEDRLAIMLNMG